MKRAVSRSLTTSNSGNACLYATVPLLWSKCQCVITRWRTGLFSDLAYERDVRFRTRRKIGRVHDEHAIVADDDASVPVRPFVRRIVVKDDEHTVRYRLHARGRVTQLRGTRLPEDRREQGGHGRERAQELHRVESTTRRRRRGMDASQACWYFSTMRHVAFHRTKYGRELLLDAAYVRQMPEFIRASGAEHSLDFHDILLVTKGTGCFLLDGEPNQVSPGVVLFTLPGQVREWRLEHALDGACLFFSRDLTADFFSDPRFLDGFAFFSPRRPTAAIVLDPPCGGSFWRASPL